MDYLNICECSGSIIKGITQCTGLCGNCTSDDCSPTKIKNIKIKNIEKHIQNQVGIPSSQFSNVLSSFSVASQLITNGRRNYSTASNYPARNLSDRFLGATRKSSSIVPTRGNSTKSSITSHKPGSAAPGGKGVDVKHGSYVRHLAILKAKNINGSNNGQHNHVNPTSVTNNKMYKFTIINSNCKCKV